MATINERLDQIIPKIKEEKFLEGRGLGNEISFYIFDYDPEDELLVRDYVKVIKKEFSIESYNRKIIEFDLYRMMIDFAKEMGIFEDIFKMEKLEGRDYLYKTLQEFVEPTIFLERIQEESEDYNTIFITGVGKVFPFLRSHTILNNLQEIIEGKPVILFFPGVYDGQSLSLFGKLKDDNYYRAFQLIDR